MKIVVVQTLPDSFCVPPIWKPVGDAGLLPGRTSLGFSRANMSKAGHRCLSSVASCVAFSVRVFSGIGTSLRTKSPENLDGVEAS